VVVDEHLVQHELSDGILEISDVGGAAEGFDFDRDFSDPFSAAKKRSAPRST